METTAAVLEMPKPEKEYGTGSIRQLGPKRFQISFYDKQGVRRRESFSTYDKAERALGKKINLRDEGKLDPKESNFKMDSLAEDYKTYIANSKPKSSYWVNLVWRVHLEPFFGGKRAERIEERHIQNYIRERLDCEAAPATVNRELTILKAMLMRGVKYKRLHRVPDFPERLREAEPRAGFVNDDQYAALQGQVKYGWLKAALAVAYNYGFRKSELIGLKVSQVDLKHRTIRLLPGYTKNDKGRVIVMTQEVFDLIAECMRDKAPGDALFTWADGTPVNDFRRTWRTLAKKAGLPGVLLHDMRRSAVRNMVRAGISKHTAKRISGHSTDAIFDRYDIGDEADLIDAAQKIEARKSGHKTGTT